MERMYYACSPELRQVGEFVPRAGTSMDNIVLLAIRDKIRESFAELVTVSGDGYKS